MNGKSSITPRRDVKRMNRFKSTVLDGELEHNISPRRLIKLRGMTFNAKRHREDDMMYNKEQFYSPRENRLENENKELRKQLATTK